MNADSSVSWGESPKIFPLIEMIYDAATDPSLWPDVLEGIADAVKGDHIGIFAGIADPMVLSSSRMGKIALRELACSDHCHPGEMITERCDSPFPTGTVRYSCPRMSYADAEGAGNSVDLSQPHRMDCRYGIKIPFSDAPIVYLACMRHRQRGPFDDHDGVLFKSLMPHLERAFGVHVRCEQVKSSLREMQSVLDTFDRAVLGLNRDGMVALSNRRAQAIVENADGLKLLDGRLVATSPEDDLKLQSWITRCLESANWFDASSSVSFCLSRDSESLPLQLTITPYAPVLPDAHGQLAALIYVSDPAHTSRSCSHRLQQLYGLTPTECRLADLLCQGFDVREAAAKLRTTLETARFHLKRVLAKTGTRRQAELIRLMLSLPGGQ